MEIFEDCRNFTPIQRLPLSMQAARSSIQEHFRPSLTAGQCRAQRGEAAPPAQCKASEEILLVGELLREDPKPSRTQPRPRRPPGRRQPQDLIITRCSRVANTKRASAKTERPPKRKQRQSLNITRCSQGTKAKVNRTQTKKTSTQEEATRFKHN